MRKIVLLVFFYFIAWFLLPSKFKGKSFDENGEPVPGASVKIENSFHAKSAIHGEFSISKAKKLVFTG
jgi:hypothetical protein